MKYPNNRLPRRKLKELLAAIYAVCLLDRELDLASLEKLSVDARRSAKKTLKRLGLERKALIDHDALGRLLFRWQRTPNYLNEEGQPIPLRARGRAPSLEALFRHDGIEGNFPRGVKHLQQLGLIRKTKKGLFVPRTDATICPTLTPELVEVLTQTLSRLVATVFHNTSLGTKKSVRLIERLTAVPNFPRKDVSAFKQFASEQGGMFISTMNDWLETRRAGQSSKMMQREPLTAGIHVFAFLDKAN